MNDVERRVSVAVNGLMDVDAAITWVVRTFDAEFKTATELAINIYQYKEEPFDNWMFACHVDGRVSLPVPSQVTP